MPMWVPKPDARKDATERSYHSPGGLLSGDAVVEAEVTLQLRVQ